MPFCSERCREIDLDNWASDKYVIANTSEDREVDIAAPDDPEGSGE